MSDGAESDRGAAWINTVLTASAPLMAAAPGGVWDGPVENATLYPLVAFSPQSPGIVVRGVGTTEIMLNSLWLVRGVCEGDSYVPLQVLATEIQAALHGVTGQAVPGGMIVSSVREEAHRGSGLISGRPIRTLGGIYRVYVQ